MHIQSWAIPFNRRTPPMEDKILELPLDIIKFYKSPPGQILKVLFLPLDIIMWPATPLTIMNLYFYPL